MLATHFSFFLLSSSTVVGVEELAVLSSALMFGNACVAKSVEVGPRRFIMSCLSLGRIRFGQRNQWGWGLRRSNMSLLGLGRT